MIKIPRVIPPIITPFDKNGAVYEEGIVNLINFLHEKSIKGIWILGSYGSFPLMTEEDRMKAAELIVPLAKRYNMTTIIQIGSPSAEIAVRLAKHAQDIGADGIASVVPFYYASAHYTEKNFLIYFKEIISNTELPLFYYNNPKTTGYTPSVIFIEKLLKAGVVGIKDTTTDFVSITEKMRLFKKLRPDGFYLGGSTSVLFPVRSMGGIGAVCGTAVAFPELALNLENSISSGDFERAKKVQETVLRVREIQGRYVGRSVSCYDILNARGIDVGICKSPWIGMTDEQNTEVITDLKALGVLP